MGSITWHDFLLGCTALCLTVCITRLPTIEPCCDSVVDIMESLKLLENAKTVCENQLTESKDTRKVRRLIEAVIPRFSGEDNTCVPMTQISNDTRSNIASNTDWQVPQFSEGGEDWLWDEGMMPAEHDPWAYMEQFLNLPIGGFTTGN